MEELDTCRADVSHKINYRGSTQAQTGGPTENCFTNKDFPTIPCLCTRRTKLKLGGAIDETTKHSSEQADRIPNGRAFVTDLALALRVYGSKNKINKYIVTNQE